MIISTSTYPILLSNYIQCICCICDTARLKTTSVDMIPVCQPCNVSDTELTNRGFLVKAINGTRLALYYRNAQHLLPEDPMFRQCVCMPYEGQRCPRRAAHTLTPWQQLMTCENCFMVYDDEADDMTFVVECACLCWVCNPERFSEEPPPRGRSRSRSRYRAPATDHEENPEP